MRQVLVHRCIFGAQGVLSLQSAAVLMPLVYSSGTKSQLFPRVDVICGVYSAAARSACDSDKQRIAVGQSVLVRYATFQTSKLHAAETLP